jgi:hypothetical protein
MILLVIASSRRVTAIFLYSAEHGQEDDEEMAELDLNRFAR